MNDLSLCTFISTFIISHSEVGEWTGDECKKVPKLRNEPNH